MTGNRVTSLLMQSSLGLTLWTASTFYHTKLLYSNYMVTYGAEDSTKFRSSAF